jgi:phage recombination protein Bet
MATRYGMETSAFEATVRATCMPNINVSREQFAAFLLVAKEYNLNPITKEIYAFPAKGGITPIVSIDGWLNLINSHPECDGMEFVDRVQGDDLLAITAKIYRKDRAHPTEVTEYMAECARPTEPWKKWPRRMLRHKAAIQCARYAFGFAGIYDPDEGERIMGSAKTILSKSAPTPPPAPVIDSEEGGIKATGPLPAVPVPEPHNPETGGIVDLDRFLDDLEGQLAGAKDMVSLGEIWEDAQPTIKQTSFFPPDREKASQFFISHKKRVMAEVVAITDKELAT